MFFVLFFVLISPLFVNTCENEERRERVTKARGGPVVSALREIKGEFASSPPRQHPGQPQTGSVVSFLPSFSPVACILAYRMRAIRETPRSRANLLRGRPRRERIRRRVSWPPGGGRSSPSWGGRAQVEDFAKVDEDLVGNSSKNSSRRRTAPAGSPTAKAAVAGFGPSSRPPPHELASQSAGLPGAFGIRSQPAEQRIRLRLSPASPIGGAPVAPEGPGAYGSPNIKHKTHCTGLYVILRR